MNFPLSACQTCHGASYTGGAIVAQSCEEAGCHVDRNGTPKSPEACNTCHGDFSAPAALATSYAPPRALNGDTLTTSAGVGAHRAHLFATYGKPVVCAECHTVPASVGAAGHIDGGSGEVAFHGSMAGIVTGDGTRVPAPAYASGSCANTYCHGNWKLRKESTPALVAFVYADSVIEGAHASPSWTSGASAGQCWSCHGGAPGVYVPKGHMAFELTDCYHCHGDVIDANGAIQNSAKHMNGFADMTPAYGTQRKMQ
jgi:predicted CxxxxCH...CXXCH cytochrome family protein